MATDAVIIAKDGERIPCHCSLLMGKSKILDEQIEKWDKSLGNVEIALPNFSVTEINLLLKYFDLPEPYRNKTEGLTFLKLGAELEMIWMSMMGMRYLMMPNLDFDLSKREELKTLMKKNEYSEFQKLYKRYVAKGGFYVPSLVDCLERNHLDLFMIPDKKFEFKIPNASNLSEEGESKTFFLHRLPWRVEAYKKAGPSGNFLGIRLVCEFGHYIGCFCHLLRVKFKIRSEDVGKDRSRSYEHVLFAKSPFATKSHVLDDTNVELPNFIEWETLMNRENKYLDNGSITIHVSLTTHRPKFFLYNDTEIEIANILARNT